MSASRGSRPRPGSRRTGQETAVAPDLACPTRQTLDRLADRWTVVLIEQLAQGPLRFGQLREGTAGISEKMLTQTLRGLERDGFVIRRADAAIAPQVEYRLAPLGHSVLEPLAAIRSWAHQHIGDVGRARLDFDEGRRPGLA